VGVDRVRGRGGAPLYLVLRRATSNVKQGLLLTPRLPLRMIEFHVLDMAMGPEEQRPFAWKGTAVFPAACLGPRPDR
jgi:hypothetical protein